ncbi:hypothetical protein RB594_007177 [Gaeumannomyces avenae]
MPRRKEKDPNAFPTRQLFILAICRFSEPIAFTSIMTYTFDMVQDLGIDRKEASFYAGLLVSAYAVAEAITSMAWGTLSDRVGRKPIVLSGLVGVALSSLIFGLSKSYWVAFAARLLGGALNGNVSVMQTMVAEMVKRPEHEPIAYAVQPFVWSLGTIIGSAMGGFLAHPVKSYPGRFDEDGLWGRYPYLLPNLVAFVCVVTAVILGIFFLDETREWDEDVAVPDRDSAVDDTDVDADETTPLRHGGQTRTSLESTPMFVESSLPLPIDEHNVDLRRSSFGTMHSIKPVSDGEIGPGDVVTDLAKKKESPFNFTVLMLCFLLLIFSYHQMGSQSLLPTHLLDEPLLPRGQLDLKGGLGYTAPDVGVYLAVNGFLGLFIQAVIFPIFVERVGVWHSLVWMVLLYPLGYLIPPFLSLLFEPAFSSAIYLSLTLQSFCGIIIFPVTLILLKEAAPSMADLGKINGLAMSGACLARTIAPPIVGLVYSVGGSGVAWFSVIGVALFGIVQLLWVPRKRLHVGQVVVENPITHPHDGQVDGVTNGNGNSV